MTEKKLRQNPYLKSAITRIYGDDEDFIVIGLTGRTGSGCSTAANILQSDNKSIKNSLFSGNNPSTNEERKERILLRHFKATWKPFLLIKVRALITTFLLDKDNAATTKKLRNLATHLTKKQIDSFIKILNELRKPYQAIIRGESDDISIADYYTKTLPKECEKLKKILGENNFVRFYQEIGTNIRLSGDPCSNELVHGKFFILAERINDVIKKIHKENKKNNKQTLIVVDAIRNSLEAIFFQDRYSSFFLMAISAPELDRIVRLRNLKYSEEDIKSIDKVEYTPRDLYRTEFYTVQDIQACLQRADLYISNPNVTTRVNEFQELANQLIRFVSLIRHPGIVTPSALERCMQIAYTAKLNSGCISRQVGAVVTDSNFSVRAVGWNDTPHGQVPCNLRSRDDLIAGADSIAYSNFERNDKKFLSYFVKNSKRYNSKTKISGGRNNAFCFKSVYNKHTKKENQVHTRSLHAEENAFLQISKYGLAAIEGGLLFTTASPCELCSKKAYQLGITKVYYVDPYPGIALDHILQGGVNNPDLILFYGAIGRAFHKLYSPIVPYKDELDALTEKNTNS